MNESLNKIKLYENVEAFLFQIDGSSFNAANFDGMESYLEKAQKSVEERITDLSSKMETLQDELKRTAGVYQFNNKKRLKEEQYLEMQREKIKKKMEQNKSQSKFSIHPITLVLRQKKNEIIKLSQTKQIILDFNKIMNGKEEDMSKTLPLDDKNFSNSALKIYVFKCLLQEMNNPSYDVARIFIKRKFLDLKTKIISNFKEGFIKKDIIIINNTLPYCEEYELMDQISDYYNLEAFKDSHKLQKLQREAIDAEIKNFFFLLKRGFYYAFSNVLNGSQKNSLKVSVILAKHNEFISRRLITFVFQKIIKETIDSVLKGLQNSTDSLLALQLFYSQCKSVLKDCQTIIQDDKLVHLMQTYFQSIFDIYLESYLNKQLHSLGKIYEQNISNIIEQIKAIDAFQDHQDPNKKQSKKFSFKKLMDYKIQTKKTYNVEYVRSKLQALSSIFMDPALQKLFQSTKYALNRNNKISKINEIDKNRNQILAIFLKEMGELINVIISSLRDVLPNFQDNGPALEHQFFQVIPHINVLLQRMEYLYSEYKKQAKYELSESIKLEQKKEDLIKKCEVNLNRIVADALACILSTQKSILREKSSYAQSQQEPISSKLYLLLEKYVKSINRITQFMYRQSLLKTLGLQFVNLLIQHYSQIKYSKQGLGGIYVDVSGFSKVLKLFGLPVVEERFKVFKCLIDIYVIKNDEKQLNTYIKTEKQGVLCNQKDEIIKKYLLNKQLVEKST